VPYIGHEWIIEMWSFGSLETLAYLGHAGDGVIGDFYWLTL
jgi:hypothetical protein